MRNRLSIKKEIFILGLFSSLVILLVFGFLLVTSILNFTIDEAKQSIEESNKEISMFTEGFFTEVTNTIEILAKNSDIKTAVDGDMKTRERALSLYQDILNVNETILYVYSGYENGELLINDYTPPEDFNPLVRPWYIAAIDSKPEISTGIPYREANSDEWVVAPSKILTDEQGNVTGVIAIDISLESIVEQLSERHVYDSQRNYVIDQQGTVIIDSDEKLIGEEFHNIQNLTNVKQGEISYITAEKNIWAYYNTIDSTDWILITEVDRSEVLQPMIRQITFYILTVLILAICLGILISQVIVKRFAEPLTELGKRISAITVGEKISKNVYKYSNYEIATIAENIEMIAEESFNKKTTELKTIIESTENGILVLDENMKVIYVNSRFKEMWDISRDINSLDHSNKLLDEVIYQVKDEDAFRAKIQSLDKSKEKDTDVIHFKDGRIFEQFSCPLINNEDVDGRLWSYRDITERKRAEEKMRILATTDELTGLWNRRYFMQTARQELERAIRYQQTFAVMILDIDHFKKINDNLGHAAGDNVLEHLSSIITNSFRKVDIPGRIGGEEFGIILPNTDLENAARLAERLRETIGETPAIYEGKEIFYTGSIGVTAFHSEISNLDEILKNADDALYEAKRRGRNCVIKKI